jgi:hypothetical protein
MTRLTTILAALALMLALAAPAAAQGNLVTGSASASAPAVEQYDTGRYDVPAPATEQYDTGRYDAPAPTGALPETGGASVLALGAGALLVAGGILARRLVR